MKKILISFIALFLIVPLSAQKNAKKGLNTNRASRAITNLDFSCEVFKIHPVDEDFTTDEEGKILISTEHDDMYYTSYQDADASVNISVEMSAAAVGTPVYFRVIDPDDQSQYETDIVGDDNVGGPGLINGMTGIVSANSVVSSQNPSLSVATVTLKITDRYAGDNYQVEASLSPSFDTNVSETLSTSVMVAWKRIYIEHDEMYKKGATIVQSSSVDFSDNIPDALFVDNIADFTENDIISVFSFDPSIAPVKMVVSAPPFGNSLFVSVFPGNPTLSYTFPSFYGVKLENGNDSDEEVYSVDLSYLDQGFGSTVDGSDGGAFIEFVPSPVGNERIPKYSTIPNSSTVINFVGSWRMSTNGGAPIDLSNYIQLLSAYDWYFTGSKGITSSEFNFTILFEAQFTFGSDNDKAMAETLVHEFGHHFDIVPSTPGSPATFPHVHEFPPANPMYRSHDDMDQGVMAYSRNFIDEIAEFYIECLSFIRNKPDPIED